MTAEVGVSRVTEKGQVTIPAKIRDQKGITPGSSLVFIELEDGILIKTADELQELLGLFEAQAEKTGLTRSQLAQDIEEAREETLEGHDL